MIPSELQDALNKELKTLFINQRFLNQDKDLESVNIFSQDLPIESNREDEDEDLFPYIITRLIDGSVDTNEPYIVRTLLIIGIYDENPNKQGYKDVLHIINMIYERFAKNPILADQFTANMPFSWSLQDEDTHPYFFGGIELSFRIPSITRRETEYD